jgi:hypothetical protein
MTWISTRTAAQRRPTSGNSRSLTARPPTWPGLGANMSRRDPDAPTDALGLHLAPGAKESRERALLQWPPSRMLRAVQSTPRGAQRVRCEATRRWRTTGRELGETAGARPERKAEGGPGFWPPHQADGRSKMGARDAIGDANGAPTKHRAGAMISTQPVANAG